MKQNYFIMFFLTLCAQLLICNYFHISAYISLSILPVAILCLPTKIGAAGTMLIAFATGLGTDFLAEGLIGLNAAALVPVAACKRFICDSVFGKELILLGEDISMRKHGIGKVTFALLIVQGIFLIVYIWADGGPARPLAFNLIRFAASLVAGVGLSLVVAHMMDPNERK